MVPIVCENSSQPIVYTAGDAVYDRFISYRVFANVDVAEKMYLYLQEHNTNAFLDKRCLIDGEDWKSGFLRGLQASKCFISLLSTKALEPCRNPDKNHEYDNYLLEMETALNISESTNNPRYIIPVTIGEYISVPEFGVVLNKFNGYDCKLYSPTVKPSYPAKPVLGELLADATQATSTEIKVQSAALMAAWAEKVAYLHRENGTKTYSNGDVYTGDLVDGETVGFGIMTYANGVCR